MARNSRFHSGRPCRRQTAYARTTILCLLFAFIHLAAATPSNLSARLEADVLRVDAAGKPVLAYHFGPGLKKPYFWPLTGPATGLSVTTESSNPYPHHNSMWFGCDHVNGRDYWHHQVPTGAIRSLGPTLLTDRGPEIVFTDRCDWLPRDGDTFEDPVLRDYRRVVVRAPDAATRVIDFTIALLPLTEIRITRTNHSLFALRMAPALAVAAGGTMINAEGDRGEKATFGKPSAWMDCYGSRDGTIEGAAILQHPSNRWFPSPWFTRDYGFFSPTPMQWLPRPLVLPAGVPLVLAYRVIVHAGTTSEARIAEHFRAFSATTPTLPKALVADLPARLRAHLNAVCSYHFGDSRKHLSAVERAVILASGNHADDVRNDITRQLAQALNASGTTPAAARFLCRQLSLLGGKDAVPALARYLRTTDDPAQREHAILALGRIRGPASTAALDEAFAIVSPRLRATICGTLGGQGDPAIPVLRHHLDNGNPAIRAAAAEALGRIGSDDAVRALQAAKSTTPPQQHDPLDAALVKALGKTPASISPNLAASLCRDLVAAEPSGARGVAVLQACLRFLPPAESNTLVEKVLTSDDKALRLGLCATLDQVPDTTVAETAITHFPTLCPKEQTALLHALSRRADPRFLPVFRQALASKHADVEAAACQGLATLGTADDATRLIRIAAGHPDQHGPPFLALERLPGTEVTRAIGQAVPTAPAAVQRKFIALLIARGDPAAAPWLLAAADDPDRRVRKSALDGLGRLGTRQERDRLLAKLDTDLGSTRDRKPFEEATVKLLRRFPEDKAPSAICAALLPKTRRSAGKASLIRILGSLGDETSLPLLVGAAHENNPLIRDAAVRALAAWPRPSAFAPLLDIARESPDLTHHVLALRACRRLLGTMSDRDPEDLKPLYDQAAACARRDEEKKLFAFRIGGVAVQDLTVESKGAYKVHRGGFRLGASWATDRKYTFTEIPPELLGATYIETTMNDRTASDKAVFLSFSVTEPVQVVVGFDNRCTHLPTWLASWEKTGRIIRASTSSCHLVAYRKRFPAGKVVLGGCRAPGVAAMYTVVVVPTNTP